MNSCLVQALNRYFTMVNCRNCTLSLGRYDFIEYYCFYCCIRCVRALSLTQRKITALLVIIIVLCFNCVLYSLDIRGSWYKTMRYGLLHTGGFVRLWYISLLLKLLFSIIIMIIYYAYYYYYYYS